MLSYFVLKFMCSHSGKQFAVAVFEYYTLKLVLQNVGSCTGFLAIVAVFVVCLSVSITLHGICSRKSRNILIFTERLMSAGCTWWY